MRGVCEHVIASINNSGTVNRVVVTSSIAAIISEADLQELVRRPVFYEDRYPDEESPKRTTERGQGYSMGKVELERLFTTQPRHGGWDCICPADNVGPILSSASKRHGALATQY